MQIHKLHNASRMTARRRNSDLSERADIDDRSVLRQYRLSRAALNPATKRASVLEVRPPGSITSRS